MTHHYPAAPKIRLVTEGGSLITLLVFALCCFAFCSALQAVTPAPDGAYPGANTAEGQNALQSLTSGVWNTALGYQALYHDTTGNFNTAEGMRALFSDTTGHHNTASGVQALYSNTTGNFNTANGVNALYHNTTGANNTATGAQALDSNTTGSNNTANGVEALLRNTIGSANTANGYQALYSNIGIDNTANGYQALYSNTSSFNTANGWQALYNNTTGGMNVASGYAAGFNLTTGDGNVDIGAFVEGVAGESNTTRIANIGSTPQNTGIYVTLDAVGGTKLGYQQLVSSRRYKEQIKPMDKGSEVLFALKPVSFRYKPEFDPDRGERFGLIAEEVEKINPDLVSYDSEGKPVTVRYEAVNAMLLNEFLKEHRKVQELKSTVAKQDATIAKQEKRIDVLTARLDDQASEIQKVSARLDLISPASQTAFNSQ